MDGKLATPDQVIADVAARQHGVISIVQLRRLGVSDDAARARVLAGRLHRLHRGVYAVGHRGLSFEARCLAAALAVGGGPAIKEGHLLGYWGAAVSHRSAATLWGLLEVQGGVCDVIVSGTGGKASRRGIRIHRSRSLHPGDLTLRHRIPVTTPARTIADLRRLVSDRELRRAIRQAEVIGLPLGEGDADRTRSDLERDFLRLCRRHRLPRPEVNVRVGPHLVDFLWRKRRLIVETDGYRYHRGLQAFHDDRARDLELRRLGYEVVRLSERHVNEDPRLVAETLADALAG